jgi:CRP-like cAMP-binding protein
MNFPASMLSWDVIVLNGYLLLNVYICGYLLYCRYQKKKPSKWFYIPFVFVAIVWAISIHTVTAFLYVGLGGRPFWNSAIVGPRFLASAFTAGPALIILALQVVRRVTASSHHQHIAERRPAAGAAGLAPPRPAFLEDLELLAHHLPELATVSLDARKRSLLGATVVEAAAGDVLLTQGATDDGAFFVLSGRVVVEREENGRSRVTRSAGAGEQFGEVSALTGTPRVATATAEEPTVVLRLPAAGLRLLMQSPKVNEIVHHRMSERLMITDRGLLMLRGIVQVSMLINVFLLANEVFKEFYSGNLHVASAKYLFIGLHGHYALVPWLNVACVLCIIGIWIEKGMGLVLPGFTPTPLGAIVEYTPTLNETLICLGIWAMGLLLYTIFLRMAVPILQGRLSKDNEAKPGDTRPETGIRLKESSA